MKFSRLISLAVSIMSLSTIAFANGIFSIDTTTSHLVLVDPTNGQVSDVGALGVTGIMDVDLTYYKGSIYAAAMTTSYQARLLKINPNTGAVEANLGYNRPGNYFDYIEGLAVAGGKLFLSSLVNYGPGNYYSDGIFEIDTDGNVLSEYGYRPYDNLADFDALEGRADGTLLSMDNAPGGYKRYHQVGSGPYFYNHINTYYDELYAVNDWALDGHVLHGVNDYTFTVGTFDEATGALISSHALSTGNHTLLGAALNPVPEPTTFAIFSAGVLALLRRRRCV